MKYLIYNRRLKVYWCKGPYNVYTNTYGKDYWDMYVGQYKHNAVELTLEQANIQLREFITNGVNPKDLVLEEYMDIPFGVKLKRY